ncbi:MAG: hypothetical protein V3V16_13200 [Melioribacteraceae bacterium]
MKLLMPPFNVCEDILDYLIRYCQDDSVEKEKLLKAIGKSKAYFNKAIEFLVEFNIISINYLNQNLGFSNSPSISLNSEIKLELSKCANTREFLQKQILNCHIIKDLVDILTAGKSEKQALKYLIANHHLELDTNKLSEILKKYISYTQKQYSDSSKYLDSVFLVINSKGKLVAKNADPKSIIESTIVNSSTKIGDGKVFVDISRIDELRSLSSSSFDLIKLLKFCDELNFNYVCENFLSVGMLTRALIDHIPPIFGKDNFTVVYGSYGTKSFRESMRNLDKSSRKISDSFLHCHIRRKETLPKKTQVNFSNDIDVLLGEIYRILK